MLARAIHARPSNLCDDVSCTGNARLARGRTCSRSLGLLARSPVADMLGYTTRPSSGWRASRACARCTCAARAGRARRGARARAPRAWRADRARNGAGTWAASALSRQHAQQCSSAWLVVMLTQLCQQKHTTEAGQSSSGSLSARAARQPGGDGAPQGTPTGAAMRAAGRAGGRAGRGRAP
jgi:hypothetical protein